MPVNVNMPQQRHVLTVLLGAWIRKAKNTQHSIRQHSKGATKFDFVCRKPVVASPGVPLVLSEVAPMNLNSKPQMKQAQGTKSSFVSGTSSTGSNRETIVSREIASAQAQTDSQGKPNTDSISKESNIRIWFPYS